MEIVKREYHTNGSGLPFVVAIVDTPEDSSTKLVILFEEYGAIAVLEFDKLISDEDISSGGNRYDGSNYEKLREELWD